ncbi:unnamed protein product [Pleuronectes platessa]|uniref:Uncharacterized protein n=1 Tax=Pleuronectes platessa TaxID=8262 RepID=A0A9N7UBH9_PLEPL|nr:unnamed protein product [Pleuronectes platessa]
MAHSRKAILGVNMLSQSIRGKNPPLGDRAKKDHSHADYTSEPTSLAGHEEPACRTLLSTHHQSEQYLREDEWKQTAEATNALQRVLRQATYTTSRRDRSDSDRRGKPSPANRQNVSKAPSCQSHADAIVSELLKNGRFPDADKDVARLITQEVTSLSRVASADSNLSGESTAARTQ